MTRHSNLLWITSLALGWIFDLLFWKQPFGINFALYSLICVTAGLILLQINGQRPARGTLWLLPLILLLVAITFIRAEPMTLFLGVALTLLLLVLLASTFLGGRWFRYGLADYFNAFLRLAGSMIARPLGFNAEVRKEQEAAGVAHRKPKIWPYIRGILIALPILMVFASLLASADAIFSQELDAVLKYFEIQNLPEYIFRLAYILAGAYVLVGVILHASTQSKDEKLVGQDRPLMTPFLGFTEAAIVLGSVTVLFTAFVAIQFRYFFGGQANITAAGFTYSEYARRGFGELVVVAFFSLLLILVLGSITRREGLAQRRSFSGLSVAIVVLVIVMLVSAYQRLILYESAYGFSRLRTYTHAALIWMGFLLGTVVVLEMLHAERLFAAVALIASLGFAVSLAMLNVDRLIVQQNVSRAAQGHDLDVPYLDSLSTDAVPALVDAYQSPSLPVAAREAVGAALFCRLRVRPETSHADWRAFTLSRWQADAAASRLGAQLNGYRTVEQVWPIRITAPTGKSYQCFGAGID